VFVSFLVHSYFVIGLSVVKQAHINRELSYYYYYYYYYVIIAVIDVAAAETA
jgi:hypothetical protein